MFKIITLIITFFYALKRRGSPIIFIILLTPIKEDKKKSLYKIKKI